ncbi:hypothetical protein Hanom_Chr12g01087151 [Helianthus anomalus]
MRWSWCRSVGDAGDGGGSRSGGGEGSGRAAGELEEVADRHGWWFCDCKSEIRV